MSAKPTHRGLIRGADNRTAAGYAARVELRETKNYWISPLGTKYKKGTGRPLDAWPRIILDLDSIVPIEGDALPPQQHP